MGSMGIYQKCPTTHMVREEEDVYALGASRKD